MMSRDAGAASAVQQLVSILAAGAYALRRRIRTRAAYRVALREFQSLAEADLRELALNRRDFAALAREHARQRCL